jgi:hypothetical protein
MVLVRRFYVVKSLKENDHTVCYPFGDVAPGPRNLTCCADLVHTVNFLPANHVVTAAVSASYEAFQIRVCIFRVYFQLYFQGACTVNI